jgi:hypothetical protein
MDLDEVERVKRGFKGTNLGPMQTLLKQLMAFQL